MRVFLCARVYVCVCVYVYAYVEKKLHKCVCARAYARVFLHEYHTNTRTRKAIILYTILTTTPSDYTNISSLKLVFCASL